MLIESRKCEAKPVPMARPVPEQMLLVAPRVLLSKEEFPAHYPRPQRRIW
ncbi:hypothetical protein BLL52_3426 [Rhodoferax antarcticus ANT.BR]|uniref:Uncharacterized protein n=1 Tax=Rhodoferax antarcticus ANT.BR TaxID=1111071 RepID=A0A1Q8YB47_9BURK|nr:hypothetical protein BLL52_3426 [Rhodoferax antarcticus ANT.BR]